jgi:beta-lactamase regulating signal transducer with metallopeptidase domain
MIDIVSLLSEQMLLLACGSTLLLGIGAASVAMCSSPAYRQRLAELTVAGVLVWIVLVLVPLPRLAGPFSESSPTRLFDSQSGAAATPAKIAHGEMSPDSQALPEKPEIPGAQASQNSIESFDDRPSQAVHAITEPSVVEPSKLAITSPTSGRWRARWQSALEAIPALYLAGATVCLVFLFVGQALLLGLRTFSQRPPGWLEDCYRELAQKSGASPASLFMSRYCSRPISWSVLSPVILLPERLCRPKDLKLISTILTHELGHIARRDALGNLLFCIATPVLYCHPLFWWLRRDWNLSAELLADDWAAWQTGKDVYVEELMELARTGSSRLALVGASGVFSSPSQFYRRMQMLLAREKPLLSRTPLMWQLFSLMLAVGGAVVASSTGGVRPAIAQAPVVAAEPNDWLRGTGDNLEIRLRGEVVNEKGEPETDAKVNGMLRFLHGDFSVKATTKGNQFEAWLPVNRGKLWWFAIAVESADGQRSFSRWVYVHELRQLAVEGMKITVDPPTRQVDVRVVYEGKPVADAWVTVGDNKRGRTNAEGIARFGLAKTDKFDKVMAWTGESGPGDVGAGDRRVGGFSFDRAPERDAKDPVHEIDLSRCRDQKIRVVDEKGNGVSDLDLVLQIGTPEKYNFIGTNENSRVTTDAKGQVAYRWFPDWKEHFAYPEIKSTEWTMADTNKAEMDGDVMVYKVKRKRSDLRRPIRGRVASSETSAGGFCVSLMTFQAERADEFEQLTAFTDAEGNFSVDALPASTYCAFVLDSRWASDIPDVGPKESSPQEPREVQLSVTKGTKVEIQITTGNEKSPYNNAYVAIKHPHRFSYRENGKTQHGLGGPSWYVNTDEQGKATVYVPRGELEVNIYEADWRAEKRVNVESVEPVAISFHRPNQEKRKITGRIVLPKGIKANLAGTKVKIGSIDESTSDVFTVEADEQGEFSLETKSNEVGVFVRTDDGKASGQAICLDVTKPIEVVLEPTIDFEGQLLDPDGKPRKGVKARIIALVGHEERRNQNGMSWNFQAAELEATTDENGNYTIAGVPANTKVYLRTASLKDPKQSDYGGELLLDPSDKRPRTVSKPRAAKREDAPLLADDYEWMLRDCPIMNFHLMVVLTDADPKSKEFAERNFNDYEVNKDVPRYMQIVVASDAEKLQPADITLMKERGWSMPKPGHVAAIALDASGKELGKIDLDITRTSAVEEAAVFVRQHIPEKHNGGQMWAEAFIEANRTGKRVIAVVGGRYCGPCFRLARWMHKHHEALEKDYVIVKIMEGTDENCDECLKKLTLGKHHGIPFFAIYDKSGERLIDAAGPLGNVGYPSGFDGKKWFRKMLNSTRQQLTEADVEAMIGTIED